VELDEERLRDSSSSLQDILCDNTISIIIIITSQRVYLGKGVFSCGK